MAMVGVRLWILLSTFIGFTGAAAIYPKADCFDSFIPEGSSVTCVCKANDTITTTSSSSSSITFSWPDHSNSIEAELKLDNVKREMNGTRYTCVMRNGTMTRNVSYELRVAYGPDASNIRINSPSPFVTDGSRELNLTCEVKDTYPDPWISWAYVTCKDGVTKPCTAKPRIEDDGKIILCSAYRQNNHNVQASAFFNLTLNYPPKEPPSIRGQRGQTILKTGNSITCTAKGSKPPVRRLLFNCSNPTLRSTGDVIDPVTSSVSSSIFVDTSQATADAMMCSCSGMWEPEPSLYGNSSTATFLLEYTATITNFTVNSTSELVVMEGDRSAVEFHCDVTGRPEVEVTLEKQGNFSTFGNTSEVSGQESVQKKIHRYLLSPVRCEDMGVFTCKANSGYLRPSTRTVRLIVNCGPRPYKGTADSVVLSGKEAVVKLVAYPVPKHFQFAPLQAHDEHNDTTDTDELFKVQCEGQDTALHLVTCRIRRGTIGGEYEGQYDVAVRNAFGMFRFVLDVRPEDTPILSAASAVLVSAMVAATVVIVIIVFVVFFVRRRRGRGRYNKRHGNRNQGDVECTRVAHRHSLSPYLADDDDPSNSPTPFVEVRPISSDIQFKSTDPSNAPVPFSHILASLSTDGGQQQQQQQQQQGDVLQRSESGQQRHEGLPVSSGLLYRAAESPASSPVPRAEVLPFFSSERSEQEEKQEEEEDVDEKGDLRYLREEASVQGDEGSGDYPTVPARTRLSRDRVCSVSQSSTLELEDSNVEEKVAWMDIGLESPDNSPPRGRPIPAEDELEEYAGLDDNTAEEVAGARREARRDSSSPLQSLVSAASTGSRSGTFITKIYLPKQFTDPDSHGQQDSSAGNEYAVVNKQGKGSKSAARPTLQEIFPDQQEKDSSELSHPRHSKAHEEALTTEAMPREELTPYHNGAYEEVVLAGESKESETVVLATEPERLHRREKQWRMSDTSSDPDLHVHRRSASPQSGTAVREPQTQTVPSQPARDAEKEGKEADRTRGQGGKGDKQRLMTTRTQDQPSTLRQTERRTQKSEPSPLREPPPPKPLKTHEDTTRSDHSTPQSEEQRAGTGLTRHRKKKTDTSAVVSSQDPRVPAEHMRAPAAADPAQEMPKPKKRTRSKLTNRRRKSEVDSETDEARILGP